MNVIVSVDSAKIVLRLKVVMLLTVTTNKFAFISDFL